MAEDLSMETENKKQNIEDRPFLSQVQEYLSSSSVHGLGQLSKSRHVFSIFIWTLTVACGIALSCYMVYNSSQKWKENPVITSVAQIPIESIIFPPVTVCPIHKFEKDQEEDEEAFSIWSVEDVVQQCRYTKNSLDTGYVCDSIQKIFNENVACVTFNNVDLTEQNISGPVKVTGVGEQNSLRLVLGSQLHGKQVKYRVFISETGTTTSKVFFDVDPAYPGEQTFFLHGIHYVQAGKGFEEWNLGIEACFFPNQRHLTFFKSYLQENCQMECQWNKTIKICGCAPKMLHLPEFEICTKIGKTCWEKNENILNDEEKDKCNCKTNCEMTHFFYSLRKEMYVEEIHVSPLLFYFDTHIITQVNLELKHTFFDKVSAIGGTFGLFCGLSIISGIEVVFYCCIMIGGFIKKKIYKVGRVEDWQFVKK